MSWVFSVQLLSLLIPDPTFLRRPRNLSSYVIVENFPSYLLLRNIGNSFVSQVLDSRILNLFNNFTNSSFFFSRGHACISKYFITSHKKTFPGLPLTDENLLISIFVNLISNQSKTVSLKASYFT